MDLFVMFEKYISHDFVFSIYRYRKIIFSYHVYRINAVFLKKLLKFFKKMVIFLIHFLNYFFYNRDKSVVFGDK